MPVAFVLDSSAILALLQDEPGEAVVTIALRAGCAVSTVNWAEVLTKLAERGEEPTAAALRLSTQVLPPPALEIVPYDEPQARATAELRNSTRAAGLSLGDRVCLALGRRMRVPVLTTDKQWASFNVGVEVRVIR